MAANKHTFIIAINELTPDQEGQHRYKYNNISFEISAREGSAQAVYHPSRPTLKTADDLMTSNQAVDALRKMHLYHILRTGKPLKVEKILVSMDDELTEFPQDKEDIPFLSTMLGDELPALPDSWKSEEMLEAVLKTTKTSSEEDLRFACLYSFLAASGKQFQIDRFTCYWMAMNSHYSYLVSCYRETPEMASLADGKQNKLKGRNIDRLALTIMMRLLGCGGFKTAQTHGDVFNNFHHSFSLIDSSRLDELYNLLYEHRSEFTYLPPEELVNPQNSNTVMDLNSQLIALWPDSVEKPERRRPETPPAKKSRKKSGKKSDEESNKKPPFPGISTSAFGFILLDYAYSMRCKYLHGSHTLPLFTSRTDSTSAAFRALSLFLERYLKEAIPAMFQDGWMDSTKRGIITAFANSSDFNQT